MTVEDEARAELMDDTRWNGMPIEATRGTAIVAPAPEFENYWAQGRIDAGDLDMDNRVFRTRDAAAELLEIWGNAPEEVTP